MCRWIAYIGAAVYLDEVVTRPARSLVHQSRFAARASTSLNGDGFGIGWYAERAAPGLYRDIAPAWSDENLLSLCAQIRAHTFFAHVRASTGTATSRANCHPFRLGEHLFMHNGQIGSYHLLRRRIEAMIPDATYVERAGTTDSEAIFLAAIGRHPGTDAATALARTLAEIDAIMRAEGVDTPLRVTAAMTDGAQITAIRWASDGQAPSLFYRQTPAGCLVASEPIDDEVGSWTPVPEAHVLQVTRSGELSMGPLFAHADGGRQAQPRVPACHATRDPAQALHAAS